MPGVEKPDNEASGPHTDRNPGAVPAEAPAAPSGARPTSSAPAPASSDTLLSLPAPSSREELAFDERLAACERRLDELVRRVETLERREGNAAETPERGHWIWLVFLVALALAWQIISFFR